MLVLLLHPRVLNRSFLQVRCRRNRGGMRHPEFQRMRVTLTIGVIGLCATAYILGAWQGTSSAIKAYPRPVYAKTQCDDAASRAPSNASRAPSSMSVPSSGTRLDFQAHHRVVFNESSLAPQQILPCQLKYSEYTPCHDPRMARKFPKAMIGVMATDRIPYPARAFDMAHCSRCLIPWNKLECLYLIEVDRVLRPGGYWIHSGPPIHWKRHSKGWQRTEEDLKQEQDEIEDLAKRLCWKKIVEKDDLAVWHKPINHMECANNWKADETPQFCNSSDVCSAWYKKMETCISPLPGVQPEEEVAGRPLENWPKRALAAPPRITRGSVSGLTPEKFEENNKLWAERANYYKKLIPPLANGRYRNVMDMNAGMGGFAAALMKYPLWVMNMVPAGAAPDALGVIYERGFIGTYHDWCEAFSTYPRTYDLILKSTDTGTERRGYAYGDTGHGIFQKQPFGDTVGIYKIK